MTKEAVEAIIGVAQSIVNSPISNPDEARRSLINLGLHTARESVLVFDNTEKIKVLTAILSNLELLERQQINKLA